MTITVKAIRQGFSGAALRRPGDVFEIESEKQLGSWMEKVSGPVPEKPKKEDGTTTLSEITRKTRRPF